MNRFLSVLLIGASVVAATGQNNAQAAQQNQSGGQLPVFRAQTQLVSVPAVVTKSGKPVAGLKQDDFSITEDGQPRQIAFFEEVKAQPRLLKPAAADPGTFTNRISDSQDATAVTMIVLDAINTPALQQGEARRKVMEFLSRSASTREPTMLAMIGRDGLKVVHDFSTSPNVLLAAVRKVRSNMEGSHQTAEDKGFEQDLTGTGDIANQMDVTKESSDIGAYMSGQMNDLVAASASVQETERRAELTMVAIEQLVRAVGGIPGRKAMLWATGGTVCEPGVSVGGLHQELVEKCNRLWRLLSTNNIAVYPIQVIQDVNPGFVGAGQQNPNLNTPRGMQTQLIFESYAKYTGGKVCGFRNDDSCFREAAEDESHYYLLSYYTAPAAKPTWRKISVKVKSPGASVRARNGYMTTAPATTLEDERKQDVALAIVSPIDYTGIPMTVRWTGHGEKEGKRLLRFQIALPPGALSVDEDDHNHIKLNVVAYAIDAQGNHVGDLTKDLNARMQDKNYALFKQQGFGYTDILEVPPGNYKVKFIVRDDLSGKMGTVTAETPQAPAS